MIIRFALKFGTYLPYSLRHCSIWVNRLKFNVEKNYGLICNSFSDWGRKRESYWPLVMIVDIGVYDGSLIAWVLRRRVRISRNTEIGFESNTYALFMFSNKTKMYWCIIQDLCLNLIKVMYLIQLKTVFCNVQ